MRNGDHLLRGHEAVNARKEAALLTIETSHAKVKDHYSKKLAALERLKISSVQKQQELHHQTQTVYGGDVQGINGTDGEGGNREALREIEESYAKKKEYILAKLAALQGMKDIVMKKPELSGCQGATNADNDADNSQGRKDAANARKDAALIKIEESHARIKKHYSKELAALETVRILSISKQESSHCENQIASKDDVDTEAVNAKNMQVLLEIEDTYSKSKEYLTGKLTAFQAMRDAVMKKPEFSEHPDGITESTSSVQGRKVAANAKRETALLKIEAFHNKIKKHYLEELAVLESMEMTNAKKKQLLQHGNQMESEDNISENKDELIQLEESYVKSKDYILEKLSAFQEMKDVVLQNPELTRSLGNSKGTTSQCDMQENKHAGNDSRETALLKIEASHTKIKHHYAKELSVLENLRVSNMKKQQLIHHQNEKSKDNIQSKAENVRKESLVDLDESYCKSRGYILTKIAALQGMKDVTGLSKTILNNSEENRKGSETNTHQGKEITNAGEQASQQEMEAFHNKETYCNLTEQTSVVTMNVARKQQITQQQCPTLSNDNMVANNGTENGKTTAILQQIDMLYFKSKEDNSNELIALEGLNVAVIQGGKSSRPKPQIEEKGNINDIHTTNNKVRKDLQKLEEYHTKIKDNYTQKLVALGELRTSILDNELTCTSDICSNNMSHLNLREGDQCEITENLVLEEKSSSTQSDSYTKAYDSDKPPALRVKLHRSKSDDDEHVVDAMHYGEDSSIESVDNDEYKNIGDQCNPHSLQVKAKNVTGNKTEGNKFGKPPSPRIPSPIAPKRKYIYLNSTYQSQVLNEICHGPEAKLLNNEFMIDISEEEENDSSNGKERESLGANKKGNIGKTI